MCGGAQYKQLEYITVKTGLLAILIQKIIVVCLWYIYIVYVYVCLPACMCVSLCVLACARVKLVCVYVRCMLAHVCVSVMWVCVCEPFCVFVCVFACVLIHLLCEVYICACVYVLTLCLCMTLCMQGQHPRKSWEGWGSCTPILFQMLVFLLYWPPTFQCIDPLTFKFVAPPLCVRVWCNASPNLVIFSTSCIFRPAHFETLPAWSLRSLLFLYFQEH